MGENIKSDEKKADLKKVNLTALLEKKFPKAVLNYHTYRSDETVVVEKDSLEKVCRFLREDSRCAFEIMIDILIQKW